MKSLKLKTYILKGIDNNTFLAHKTFNLTGAIAYFECILTISEIYGKFTIQEEDKIKVTLTL